MNKRFLSRLTMALAVLIVLPVLSPRLLAFPHSATIGADRVWSTSPLNRPEIDQILADANQRLTNSPLTQGTEGRDIYLTDGGWRWLWLANTTSGAFALTRPLNNAIVVNHADISANRVSNGAAIGGNRSMASVIAHEKCHGMLRRHFGFTVDFTKPQWVREGYCDHVAGESSLSEQDVAQLQATGAHHPALPYFLGRKRVAASLAVNGGSVDRLFDEAR